METKSKYLRDICEAIKGNSPTQGGISGEPESKYLKDIAEAIRDNGSNTGDDYKFIFFMGSKSQKKATPKNFSMADFESWEAFVRKVESSKIPAFMYLPLANYKDKGELAFCVGLVSGIGPTAKLGFDASSTCYDEDNNAFIISNYRILLDSDLKITYSGYEMTITSNGAVSINSISSES